VENIYITRERKEMGDRKEHLTGKIYREVIGGIKN
jgi:hypothetical protein